MDYETSVVLTRQQIREMASLFRKMFDITTIRFPVMKVLDLLESKFSDNLYYYVDEDRNFDDGVMASLETEKDDCHELIEQQTIAPLGHAFNEGTITKNPTCTQEGEKTISCTRDDCNHSYIEPIAPTGHEFSNEWTIDIEPTLDREGSKSHHCIHDGCNEVTDVTPIDKLPPQDEPSSPTNDPSSVPEKEEVKKSNKNTIIAIAGISGAVVSIIGIISFIFIRKKLRP